MRGRCPAVAIISLAIAYRAGVFPITFAFLSTYALFLLAFIEVAPQIFAPHHYGLIGPSLIMFASFMITDPKTAPKGLVAGLLHGFAVACTYFVFEGLGIQYALFVASFSVAALNALSHLTDTERRIRVFLTSVPYPSLTNLATSILVACLCIAVYAHLRTRYGAEGHSRPIALKFILMGVEGEGLRACSAFAKFDRVDDPVLTRGAATTGAAWGDYDSDGDDDLLVTYLDTGSTLIRNDDGALRSLQNGISLPPASAGFFVDYDDDSDLDIVLFGTPRADAVGPAESRGITVFRNNGGTFTDATQSTGLYGFTSPDSAGVTATFADFDKDGLLDLVVSQSSSRFELFSRSRTAFKKMLANPAIRPSSLSTCNPEVVENIVESQEKLQRGILAHMPLETFYGQGACLILQRSIALSDTEESVSVALSGSNATIVDAVAFLPGSIRAYRNLGGYYAEKSALNRTVAAIAKRSAQESIKFGVPGTYPYSYISGAYFQPVAFDYDEDGLTDLFIAIDYGSNLLLKNLGDWDFVNRTEEAGLDYYSNGMGADVSDYNRDGHLDLVVTNTLEDYVYKNTGGTFENTTLFTDFARTGFGWGVSFLDYDLDGHDDIFITNGDPVRNNDAPDGALTRPLFRTDNLYRNRGDGTYRDMNGTDLCADAESGRALAVSDYDNDGDPDVFVGNREWQGVSKPENYLYKNGTAHDTAHFVKIRLRGTHDNSFGIGAIVRLESDTGTQTKIILAGSSFRSQNSSDVLFGLGTSTNRVDLHITWPSGTYTVVRDVPIDETTVVRQ